MAKKRRFVTRQRIGTKKFMELKRHAFFLAKHIRRFVSFNLLDKANFFTQNLFEMICENPRLRKKHPVLTKIVEEMDAILWEKIPSDFSQNQ